MKTRRGVGKSAGIPAMLVAATAIILLAILLLSGGSPSSTTTHTSLAGGTQDFPNCSRPCVVWKTSAESNPTALAVPQDDSFVATGNGSGVYLFDNDDGEPVWGHNLDHTISSISISAEGDYVAAGGWQLRGGCPPNLNISGPHSCPAAFYTNGAVYLFEGLTGKLLWSVDMGSTHPIFKVKISADGSAVAALAGDELAYLGRGGQVLWTHPNLNGPVGGMDMSSDGKLVLFSGAGSVEAFDESGALLWSHPTTGEVISANGVAVSSDASRVWVGSGPDGSHGTLYSLRPNGTELWERVVNSPALSIHAGRNETSFITTNYGALLYSSEGSLLLNITSTQQAAGPTAESSSASCHNPIDFWSWNSEGGGGQSKLSFFDAAGGLVSSFAPGGYIADAILSPDREYALVPSSQDGGFSLSFVFLGLPVCATK